MVVVEMQVQHIKEISWSYLIQRDRQLILMGGPSNMHLQLELLGQAQEVCQTCPLRRVNII